VSGWVCGFLEGVTLVGMVVVVVVLAEIGFLRHIAHEHVEGISDSPYVQTYRFVVVR
jgi:hypothetical protein